MSFMLLIDFEEANLNEDRDRLTLSISPIIFEIIYFFISLFFFPILFFQFPINLPFLPLYLPTCGFGTNYVTFIKGIWERAARKPNFSRHKKLMN